MSIGDVFELHPKCVVRRRLTSADPPTPICSYPFFLPYLVPLLTVLTQYSSSPWRALIPVFFVWIVVPCLDHIIALSPTVQLNPLQRKQLDRRPVFLLAVHLWCPTYFGILLWAVHRINTFHLHPLQLFGLLFAIGLIAAEGINVSHELLHRRNRFEPVLAKLMLMAVQYTHFTIEHSKGHHFRAATPMDPATMRYGESFYRFLPRTVFLGYLSAWRIENTRLRHLGLSVFSLQNQMLQFLTGQMMFVWGFGFFYGVKGVAVLLFQALFAIVLLEQVNAIEHYGLMRRLKKDGEFETVGPRHSWDAPLLLSNFVMFKLQLHPDHHLHASRRYQSLQNTKGSPQLPYGYLTLAPMLLIPQLWRAVMDPVLNEYKLKWAEEDLKQASNFG
ncbi:unnamed protein product [Agarophyton chilense]